MAKVPEFKTEEEESEFWDTHSSIDFLEDTEEVDIQFIGPPPQNVPVSLRFDQEIIDRIKTLASQRGISYTTLLKIWVKERLAAEIATNSPHKIAG